MTQEFCIRHGSPSHSSSDCSCREGRQQGHVPHSSHPQPALATRLCTAVIVRTPLSNFLWLHFLFFGPSLLNFPKYANCGKMPFSAGEPSGRGIILRFVHEHSHFFLKKNEVPKQKTKKKKRRSRQVRGPISQQPSRACLSQICICNVCPQSFFQSTLRDSRATSGQSKRRNTAGQRCPCPWPAQMAPRSRSSPILRWTLERVPSSSCCPGECRLCHAIRACCGWLYRWWSPHWRAQWLFLEDWGGRSEGWFVLPFFRRCPATT